MNNKKPSQREQILKHLESGKTITPLEALNLFDCFRLSDVIFKLRKEGYDIRTKDLKVKSNKIVAQYSIYQQKILK